MSIYIAQPDFIKRYVRRNSRVRDGFLDLSRVIEKPEPRDMVSYLIAATWDVENSQIPKPHKIAGLEGNGMVIAGLVADRRDYPLVSVRERFQLAGDEGDIITVVYTNSKNKERTVELRKSSVWEGFRAGADNEKPKIVIVDDVLRTGSKMLAAAKAIRQAGGTAVGVYVIAAVDNAGGLERLEKAGIPTNYILRIDMEKLKRGDYLKDDIDLSKPEPEGEAHS